MQIEEKVNSFILANTTVTDIIATRLFPDEAPAIISEPHIVYSTDGIEFIDTLEGVCDLEKLTFIYECFSSNKQEAKDMAVAIARIFARDTYTQVSGRYISDNLWIQCASSRIGPSMKIPSEIATSQPLFYYAVYVDISYKNL